MTEYISPKDFTMILVNGTPFIIYYKNYTSFERLPDVAKGEETKKEYEEYWDWVISHDVEFTFDEFEDKIDIRFL